MGFKVKEIIIWVLQFIVTSVLLGTIVQAIRGFIQGRRDAYADRWKKDKDVLDFLEHADKQGPFDEEDDKIYTIGGLTADKDEGFKKWVIKNKYKYEQSLDTIYEDEEDQEEE